jgi:hypothetical protein
MIRRMPPLDVLSVLVPTCSGVIGRGLSDPMSSSLSTVRPSARLGAASRCGRARRIALIGNGTPNVL